MAECGEQLRDTDLVRSHLLLAFSEAHAAICEGYEDIWEPGQTTLIGGLLAPVRVCSRERCGAHGGAGGGVCRRGRARLSAGDRGRLQGLPLVRAVLIHSFIIHYPKVVSVRARHGHHVRQPVERAGCA